MVNDAGTPGNVLIACLGACTSNDLMSYSQGARLALFLSASAHAQANLIQNGSFETYIAVPHRVPPWTPAPSLNVGWSNAPDGRNYAHIETLSQDVSTVPGLFYAL